MRTVAIVEARMNSSRLPGKVLAEVAGKPLLQHMIERLRHSKTLDDIIVATPLGIENMPIWELLWELRTGEYRGSEDDVLGRVLNAAIFHRVDIIVETTGDSPLLDPLVVDYVVEAFRKSSVDFCSNAHEAKPLESGSHSAVWQRGARLGAAWQGSVRHGMATFPRGQDVRVFPTSVLAEVASLAKTDADREHVSLYAWEHPERFRCLWVPASPKLADDIRLTVDEPEDLELIRAIFEAFAPRNDFSLQSIYDLLASRPELREINRYVKQKSVR